MAIQVSHITCGKSPWTTVAIGQSILMLKPAVCMIGFTITYFSIWACTVHLVKQQPSLWLSPCILAICKRSNCISIFLLYFIINVFGIYLQFWFTLIVSILLQHKPYSLSLCSCFEDFDCRSNFLLLVNVASCHQKKAFCIEVKLHSQAVDPAGIGNSCT